MIYPIVAYGAPVLKTRARPIEKGSVDLDQLITDMYETMYHAQGVGLAAPQIGLGIRLFVIDAGEMEEGEKRDAYAHLIANLMKKQFLTWNRDTVPDGVILKDLAELSKGKLKLKEEVQLASTSDLLRAQQNGPRNEVDTRKRQGGGNKKRHRNRKKRY